MSASLVQLLVNPVRDIGIRGCEEKARWIARGISLGAGRGPLRIVNIGGGRNERWPAAECIDAMHDTEMDFNTKPLPPASGSIDIAICEQVVEHLHNTTWFVSELFRILKLGGHLLISTENLGSLPNLVALLCGKAPFSTQSLCGEFLGGWKTGPANPDCKVPMCHPAFSGQRGHVRVMTNGQFKAVLTRAGFQIASFHRFAFNHYVLAHCIKPHLNEAHHLEPAHLHLRPDRRDGELLPHQAQAVSPEASPG